MHTPGPEPNRPARASTSCHSRDPQWVRLCLRSPSRVWCSTSASSQGTRPQVRDTLPGVPCSQDARKKLFKAALQSNGSLPAACTSQPASWAGGRISLAAIITASPEWSSLGRCRTPPAPGCRPRSIRSPGHSHQASLSTPSPSWLPKTCSFVHWMRSWQVRVSPANSRRPCQATPADRTSLRGGTAHRTS